MDRIFFSLLIGFFISVLLSPLVIKVIKKLKANQTIYEYVDMHKQKANTPTMGGVIMLLVSVALSFVVSLKYPDIMPVALVTLGYGLVGFIDDFIKLVLKNPQGLKPSLKMLGLILVSVIFVVYLTSINFGTDTYIPIWKTYIDLPTVIYIPAMVFIMLACTNSLNLTDGLDGLAAGVNTIIMIFFTFIAMTWGDKEMSTFSAIMTGTSIGFLLFNIYPAKVFMGDTGSLALGGAFCSVAIMLKMPLILVVVAGICVIEAISVILQVGYFKATGGKRLFKMAPFHHHLELSGVKETVIVPSFWLVTSLLCIVGAFIL